MAQIPPPPNKLVSPVRVFKRNPPPPSPQVKLRSAVPGLACEILEFVHALCVYIELWMHAGSLESTKDA